MSKRPSRPRNSLSRDFWLGQIGQGLTREVVLVGLMFSDEFRVFTACTFGNTAVRREFDAAMALECRSGSMPLPSER